MFRTHDRHNKKEQDQLPAHTYQRDTNVGKKKSSVHIQLSDWLRTLDMVPVTGLEPVRCRQRWILSPLRLPIPTHRQVLNYYSALSGLFQEENLHLSGKSFTPRPGGGKRCGFGGAGPEAVKCTAQKRRAFETVEKPSGFFRQKVCSLLRA